MRGSLLCGSLVALTLVVACGGSSRPADGPESASPSAAPEEDRSSPAVEKSSTPGDSDADSAAHPEHQAEPAPGSSAKKADVPTPDFKPNGSVADAINAVPQGTPRLNIEQEALGRPLGNVELYESCKPGNSHVKARVAVWDGKAVGLDLTTTPKNAKFAECVAEKIRGITWPDKVKALNIVEYTY
jgi:hypothetical protein